MKRLYIGAIAATVGLWACQGDPTASLRGGPFLINILPGLMFISEGDERPVQVKVEDQQLNTLSEVATATSSDGAVFTVRKDTLKPTNGVTTQFFVSAVAPGQAKLNVSAGGLTSDATINVLPLTFGGAPSTTTPQVGQPYTLASTATLKFGANTKISFGEGECGPEDELEPCPIYGLVTSQTADAITVIVPMPDGGQPAPLTVEKAVITYVTGLEADLPTADDHDIQTVFSDSDAPDPSDPDATFTIANGDPPTVFYDGFTSSVCTNGAGSDCDRFYTLSLAGSATFTVELEWYTDADVDILYCDVGCNNYEGNFDGATGANPEMSTVTLAAGTYNLWFNMWSDEEVPPHLFKVTITPQ